MKVPGYRRRDPDPISPGVMASTPSVPPLLPKPRWKLRCHLLGCLPKGHTLKHRGEHWAVLFETCARCHKLLDGGRAEHMQKTV